MNEKSNLKTKCENACWVICALALYGGLLAWAAGADHLPLILIAVAAGITAAILDAA